MCEYVFSAIVHSSLDVMATLACVSLEQSWGGGQRAGVRWHPNHHDRQTANYTHTSLNDESLRKTDASTLPLSLSLSSLYRISGRQRTRRLLTLAGVIFTVITGVISFQVNPTRTD